MDLPFFFSSLWEVNIYISYFLDCIELIVYLFILKVKECNTYYQSWAMIQTTISCFRVILWSTGIRKEWGSKYGYVNIEIMEQKYCSKMKSKWKLFSRMSAFEFGEKYLNCLNTKTSQEKYVCLSFFQPLI